jgi:uncharacterized protein YutE (UPF0331/DUF86 family)
MKYNGIVEKKLRVIEEMISEIEYWNITSFAMLQENVLLQRAVERELQVAIEAVIDTAERILAIVYATIKNKIPVFREFVDAVRNTK